MGDLERVRLLDALPLGGGPLYLSEDDEDDPWCSPDLEEYEPCLSMLLSVAFLALSMDVLCRSKCNGVKAVDHKIAYLFLLLSKAATN